MVEPARLDNFLLLFASAAGVVLLGAVYAALFALARIGNFPRLIVPAYLAFAGLCASVAVLAYAANLYGERLWMALIAVMLVGYLLAPQAILRLCRGTHS